MNTAALSTSNTALNLTNAEVCGIFSGKTTSWSSITGAGTAGLSGAIHVAFRNDGSGTSFLFTQHLAAVCNTTNSAFTTTITPSTTFASLPFPGGTVPSNFTGASGTPGVQAAIIATTDSIGYLSPDATLIAPVNNGKNVPPVAEVGSVQPLPANVTTALGTATAPTGTAASNPANWVPAVPNPASGYPIVGYTTWEVSSCYASSTVATGVSDILASLYDTTGSIDPSGTAFELAQNGFVPVSDELLLRHRQHLPDQQNLLAINNTTSCAGKTGR